MGGTTLMAAGIAALLIRLLRPWLVRYALARPNARSSHRVPTPQGGGIAVVVSALAVATAPVFAMGGTAALPGFAILAGGAIGLAILGGIDDIRPLSARVRLMQQIATVAVVVAAMGPARILPEPVPIGIERALLVLAGVWWVNAVNFMDGIDWITVAGMVPLTAALACFGIAGFVPPIPAIVAAALCGGLLGFAPANRPVARLFLGDVGSLPIGLLTGWMLLALASAGHLAAACLLPLYHLADATLTLLLRLSRGERVWEAHRSHFYQRARDHGFSVMAVVTRVFALNVALCGLAAATVWHPAVQLPALSLGLVLVGLTLRTLVTPRSL